MKLTVFNIQNPEALVADLKPILGVDQALFALEASAEEEIGRAFVQLISDAASWKTILGIPAGVFLYAYAKEFGKRAASQTADFLWRNKEESKPIEETVSILMRSRRENPNAVLQMGVQLPGTPPQIVVACFTPSDEKEAAFQLAQFVVMVEEIEGAMSEEAAKGNQIFLGRRVEITLLPDGSFRAQWLDLEGGAHERKISRKEEDQES